MPPPLNLSSYRSGMRAGLAFVPGVFVLSASFGVVAAPVMGSLAPIAMSVLVFAGSAQFGATAVLAAGGGAATAIATGAMLNSRFLPMGVAAAPALRGGWLRRALEGQTIVDTSWALAARGGGGFDRETMLGATLVQYPAWVLGTATGVLAGEVLGDPEKLGLDAILPAFFLALIAAELERPRAVAAIAIGGAIAMTLTPVLPAGLPVLLASAGSLIGLVR
jgi:predicted branched-subunit amino acid permease